MRSLLCVLLAGLAFAACGTDDLQRFRDTADDAVQSVRDGVPSDELRGKLREVRRDLRDTDLPDAARRELEDARDQLERALR